MEGKRLILFMERTKAQYSLDRRGQHRHVGTYLCTPIAIACRPWHPAATIKIRIDNSQLRTSRNPKLACLDRRHTNQLERHSGRFLHRNYPHHLSRAGTSLPVCKRRKIPHPCKHIQRFGQSGVVTSLPRRGTPNKNTVTGHGKTSRLKQR